MSSTSTSTLGKPTSNTPWLQSLHSLGTAYPAISCFLNTYFGRRIVARDIVRKIYEKKHNRLPGRCVLLEFLETSVADTNFHSPEELVAHLDSESVKARLTDSKDAKYRLWILEDLEPEWMEVLGSRIGVDPQVFGEQMNTFNFTDSHTIQTRQIPSMVDPSTWFALRYFEIRQLSDPESIKTMSNQMTFAMNPRRIEPWKDIDCPTFHQKWRHAFVRRCASFWTNQTPDIPGWDGKHPFDPLPPAVPFFHLLTPPAVILVDPPYNSVPYPHNSPTPYAGSIPPFPQACTILQSPTSFSELKDVWEARDWNTPGSVAAAADYSTAYHGGATTLTSRTSFSPSLLSPTRDLTSLFDEQILHWTRLAPRSLIASARARAADSAHYLLRSLAPSWGHQLDLVQATVAQSEYWGDDHAAPHLGSHTSKAVWEAALNSMSRATHDMNYLRRQLRHLDAHLGLNIERLGVVEGWVEQGRAGEGCGGSGGGGGGEGGMGLAASVRDARRDFVHARARLGPMVERAAALNQVARELAGLHATFKGIRDSEFGVRLSLIASVVFPMTLVATVFSMGGPFLPGQGQFWIFWVISVPISGALGIVLLYGRVLREWLGALGRALVRVAEGAKDARMRA